MNFRFFKCVVQVLTCYNIKKTLTLIYLRVANKKINYTEFIIISYLNKLVVEKHKIKLNLKQK